MDVLGREQSEARNGGMSRRRIVCEEDYSEIFPGARAAAHVQETARAVESCLFALTTVSFVCFGRRSNAEEFSI